MGDVQNTDIRAPLDVLQVGPRVLNLPNIDERTLSWVYPLAGEFLAYRAAAWRTAAVSINGATIDVRDDGSVVGITQDATVYQVAADGRFYTAIRIAIAGGAVDPMPVVVSQLVIPPGGGVQGYRLSTLSIANPGEACVGPIYVPPGQVLQVQNQANGGAGDTMTVFALGALNARGTPAILTPGRTVSQV